MSTKIILALFITLFIMGCNSPADSPYPDIVFNKLTPMPGRGRASSVAFTANGKAYVTLGRNYVDNGENWSSIDSLKSCWEFDPQNNSWKEKSPFPGLARVKAIAATINDIAYLGLGFKVNMGAYSDSYLNDFWMYEPNIDKWTRKADFPGAATNACATFTLNSNLYISSGFNGYSFNEEVWKYEPSKDKWTRLNNFNGPRRSCAVACTNGEKVFFGTGYRTFSENDWWQYIPDSDSWKKMKSMPDNGRENAIALSINDRIFVGTGRHFGGTHTGGSLKSDILEYDVQNNRWYNRGQLPAEGRENAISFTINGKGYIGFGDNDNHLLNDFWSFQP